MWIMLLALRHVSWSLGVLRKFFFLVPLQTLFVVTMTLVSQFAKLLAFFLPLKVIVLVGSTGIPRYFPSSWAIYDRETLVVALSVAAVTFYIIHLLSEKLLSVAADRGAAGVVERSQKMVMFNDQAHLSSQAYRKLSAGLSTGVLSVLLCLFFIVFYPYFFMMLAIYFIVSLLGVSLATHWQPAWRAKLQENTTGLVGLLSGVGFLSLFAFMVADFLLWDGVGFMVAIISLLLSRQLLGRIEGVVKDALWLHEKKAQINAIFFTGHQLQPEQKRQKKLWDTLSLVKNPADLFPFLEDIPELSECVVRQISCRWKQTGLADVLAFEVTLSDGSDFEYSYLLKIFGSRHKKSALNEADLLFTTTGKGLPSLELVKVSQLSGFDAHLFKLPVDGVVKQVWATRQLFNIFSGCWQVEPSNELSRRYLRSHPVLHQRLSPRLLDRLIAVASHQNEIDIINKLNDCFDEMLSELKSLPMAIVNAKVGVDLTFISNSGCLYLAHWGDWKLEPVGFDYPIKKRWHDKLQRLLLEASRSRIELENVPLRRIRLCSYCCAFEKAINKQRYAEATMIIHDILACLPSEKTSLNDSVENAVSLPRPTSL